MHPELVKLRATCETHKRAINRLNSQLKAEEAAVKKANTDAAIAEAAARTAVQKQQDAEGFQVQAVSAMQSARQAAEQARLGKEAAENIAAEAVSRSERLCTQLQDRSLQQHQQAMKHPSLLQVARSALDHRDCGTRLNTSRNSGELCPGFTLHLGWQHMFVEEVLNAERFLQQAVICAVGLWLLNIIFLLCCIHLELQDQLSPFAFAECGCGQANCDQRVLNACRHVAAEADILQAAGKHLTELAEAAQAAARESLLRTVEQAMACFFNASGAVNVAAMLGYHCLEADCRIAAEFHLPKLVQSATPLCQNQASIEYLVCFKQWLVAVTDLSVENIDAIFSNENLSVQGLLQHVHLARQYRTTIASTRLSHSPAFMAPDNLLSLPSLTPRPASASSPQSRHISKSPREPASASYPRTPEHFQESRRPTQCSQDPALQTMFRGARGAYKFYNKNGNVSYVSSQRAARRERLYTGA